jgi:hypothetical protein
MIDDVVIEMMSTDALLWRCLHGGPLTRDSIDQWEPDCRMPWARLRARNVPLLTKLTQAYGACAIIARDGDRIVGQLRFYPKTFCSTHCPGGVCLQQDPPAGPTAALASADFPPLEALADKTLSVHCIMTGSPQQKDNPYQRKGLASHMVRTLIEWARAQGWHAIEAIAYEDLPILYAITGQAGRTFWDKLGFQIAATRIEPEFEKDNDFTRTVRQQAAGRGLDLNAIKSAYSMRLDLV